MKAKVLWKSIRIVLIEASATENAKFSKDMKVHSVKDISATIFFDAEVSFNTPIWSTGQMTYLRLSNLKQNSFNNFFTISIKTCQLKIAYCCWEYLHLRNKPTNMFVC